MARKARVLGGYTIFHWGTTLIGFAESIQVTPITPVVDPTPVHPMNYAYPAEIVTPRASSYGTIVVTNIELWDRSVWENMDGLAGKNDIIDIFEFVANQNDLQVTKFIRIPGGSTRSETFFGVVVANVDDAETVDRTTMTQPKAITLWYTHSRKSNATTPVRSPYYT